MKVILIVLCFILQIEAQKHESFEIQEPYLQQIGTAKEEGFVSAKLTLDLNSTKYLFVIIRDGFEHLEKNRHYSQASQVLTKEGYELKEYEINYNKFLRSLSQQSIPQDINERAIVTIAVGIVFLFASIASAVSLYLSLETQHRLDTVVEAMEKNAEIFEEQLKESDQIFQNLQYEKLALEDINSEMQFNQQLAIWERNFLKLKTIVNQEKSIVTGVLKNRLPEEFFDIYDEEEIFNRMEKQCQKNNVQLTLSKYEFRFTERVKTSGIVKQGSIDIYLSFPYLLKEHQVFKLIPTPIAIPGTDKIHVISDNDKKEYLLKEVIKDEREIQKFGLISEAQINKDCKQKMDIFECKNLGVDLNLETIKNSCLGKLILKETQEIEEFCKIEVKKSVNKVEKLGKNRFITHVNEPVEAHVYCKQKDTETGNIMKVPFDQFTLYGTEIHSLKPNCEAITKPFTFRAELDIDFVAINQTQLQTNFSVFNQKIPNKLTKFIDQIDLDNQHGRNMKDLLKEYKQKIEESENFKFPNNPLSFLFKGIENFVYFMAIFPIILVIGLLVALYFKCCYKKKK